MGRLLFRSGAIGLILVCCAAAGAAGLPVVLEQLGLPFPVRLYNMGALAAIALEPDGRIIVHLPAFLMHFERADVIAFLYLHEVGHARLGHLLPLGAPTAGFLLPQLQQKLLWQLELDADGWAAREALRRGYDPLAGLETIFGLWGGGSGTTHPHDAERIAHVRRIAASLRR